MDLFSFTAAYNSFISRFSAKNSDYLVTYIDIYVYIQTYISIYAHIYLYMSQNNQNS